MNVRVYQIDDECDAKHVAFLSYKDLRRFSGTDGVNSSIYRLVFDGDVVANTLEGIYSVLSVRHPDGYVGHTLSVSDIVKVEGGDVKPGFYYCNDFGFIAIEFDESKALPFQPEPTDTEISVLVVKPGQKPELKTISSSLKSMQAVVGGDIEEYCPFADEVAIICNEEGKINGLPLNRGVFDEDTHKLLDIIAGTFIVAYAPLESEHFRSLPEELAVKYAALFEFPERFYRDGNDIKVVKVQPTSATVPADVFALVERKCGPLDAYTIELVSNIIAYALKNHNVSKHQAAYFISDLIPGIEFDDVDALIK